MNAVKCELSQTFEKSPDLRALVQLSKVPDDDSKGDDPQPPEIKGKLTLSNVVVNSGQSGLGATIPFGLSINAGGSSSANSSRNYTINFTYDLDDEIDGPGGCLEIEDSWAVDGANNVLVAVKDKPFEKMLRAVAHEHAKVIPGDPKADIASISYSSAFSISNEIKGGVGFSFLVFNLSGGVSEKVSDGQSLNLEFNLNLDPALLNSLQID